MGSMSNQEREKLYLPMYLLAAFILLLVIWYYCYGVIDAFHMHGRITDYFVFDVAMKLSLYRTQWTGKAVILVSIILTQIVKAGKSIKTGWGQLLTELVIALVVFLFPLIKGDTYGGQSLFLFTSVLGFILCGSAIGRIGRKINGIDATLKNDALETFDQCREKIENEYSVNIPTRFKYKGKYHRGWINVINPFRATMVLGTPGSGKSFSVYNPFIEGMIRKAYTMFLYDYKYPDLTKVVYNLFLENKDKYIEKYGKVPQFCVLNFNDPRYSMRCNPLHPKYINDPADTSEVADIIMRNINPHSIEKEDFFSMSAKVYIDALIYFLRRHQDGKFCDFPHLIELMGRNYKATFKMLQKYPEIDVKMVPFRNALKGNAQEQLQGQIASAQIPLMRFASPALYWVLSGDDFTLDINNPDAPKIVCVGNDPKRQSIYGTTLALYTSRTFSEINSKGKLPCAVLLDEVPTIFIKGLDNLIATARSNKVAIVLGAQDKSQLVRDYTEKEADVIFNTVGNVFAGQVNGRTAKDLAETFGREFREQQSETTGGDNASLNRSFQQQEILPQSRIETLSQGYFFGKVADNNDQQIRKKLFCGAIQIDVPRWIAKEKSWVDVPKTSNFGFGTEEIEKEVRANAEGYCCEHIFDELMKQDKEAAAKTGGVRQYNEDTGWDEAVRRYKDMKSDAIEKLIKTIIAEKEDAKVNEVVQQNYQRIRDDIQEIFRYEGISEDNPDGEEEEEEEEKGKEAARPVYDDETKTNTFGTGLGGDDDEDMDWDFEPEE